MNNEIKEILDNLKNKDNDIKGINFLKYQDLTRGEINLLLDYITNLQQEINKLTAESTEWESKCYDLQQENERLKEELVKIPRAKMEYDLELDDYKSRCEKASDNLKRNYWIKEHEHNDDVVNMTLNILQNGSDSQ